MNSSPTSSRFHSPSQRPRDTLGDIGATIVAGQAAGLVGIFWATGDFTFDPDSATGWVPIDGPSAWLNSDAFQLSFGPIEILAAHETTGAVVPGLANRGLLMLTTALITCGLTGLVVRRRVR